MHTILAMLCSSERDALLLKKKGSDVAARLAQLLHVSAKK